MIEWAALLTATAWVDFAVIAISKVFPLTKALGEWYREFGLAAVGSDILIIVLGIALAKFLVPMATGWSLVGVAVLIQVIHDVLFYVGVIRGIPAGHNRIIDLFKRYASEGGWKIILADAGMVTASVLLMEWMSNTITDDQIAFLGLLAVYSLLYIIYTK
jgi:hypothetical protein